MPGEGRIRCCECGALITMRDIAFNVPRMVLGNELLTMWCDACAKADRYAKQIGAAGVVAAQWP